jgi:excisionase family DNA binding protein
MEMLSVKDVAARLRISLEQVLTLIRSGALKASNVGLGIKRPRWRISESDLQAFLDKRAPKPARPKNRRPLAVVGPDNFGD